MAKEKTIFVCANCGAESYNWSGRCYSCGEWNTLKEIEVLGLRGSARGKKEVIPEKLKDIRTESYQRISVGFSEFDRVLGGGIVPGSLILLGGEPGIGKSTLLLQVAASLASDKNKKVLYVSGEESGMQIKMRANRLGINCENIYLVSETNIDYIVPSGFNPSLVIIDSIQTMYDENYPSTPGSIVQVRECGLKLQKIAKTKGIPIFVVGHVTKEGAVAGPKTLEHLVDVVLYLEGERFQNLRMLHGVKNRFGTTDEIGMFEMTEKGFSEVKTPSKTFLEERIESPGSAVTSILSGTRAFLVEIQSLISKTPFGYPKRLVSGFDLRRLDLLLAILQKKMRLPLSAYDVYVNIVGGVKIEDRAADLALCCSIYSVFKNKKILPKTILVGEVGLSGEIRSVAQLNKRIKEAKALGFNNIIGPEAKTLDRALKMAIEAY